MKNQLDLSFLGADRRVLVERAVAAGLLPAGAPSATRIEGAWLDRACEGEPGWGPAGFAGGAGAGPRGIVPARGAAELAERCDDLRLEWADGSALELIRARDHLRLVRPAWDVTAEGTMALLRELPFEACTTGGLYPGWSALDSVHGWALVLKGRGHRLVSERVIPRGPWWVRRDDDADLTMLQLHDLDASRETAMAQARPGLALLAPMWEGGHWASHEWAFRSNALASGYRPTFYDRAARRSVVLVQDREVSAAEMGIAAGTRVHQVFPEPVEQVAFVYLDEAAARRQVGELWLYGLEVRAMTAEGERRIDTDVRP